MKINNAVSILTLATLLTVSPSALAQGLDVGADVNIGGADGIQAGAEIGAGDAELGVDAQVGAGGSAEDGGLDADVDVSLGSGSNAEGPGVEPAVPLGSGMDTAAGGATAGSIGLLGLGDEALEVDALITLLEDPNLASVDLDAVVDDTRVSIVDIEDLIGAEAIAQIDAAIADGASGRDRLLADIQASAELSSVLARDDVPLNSVVALRVGPDGATDVLVRAGTGEATAALSLGVGAGGGADDRDGPGEAPGTSGGDGKGSSGSQAPNSGTIGSGVSDPAATGLMAVDVAMLPCPAGLQAMVGSGTAGAQEIASASELSIIALTGCSGSRSAAAADIAEIRAAIITDGDISSALDTQGFTAQDVIGASASGDVLVLYVNA